MGIVGNGPFQDSQNKKFKKKKNFYKAQQEKINNSRNT